MAVLARVEVLVAVISTLGGTTMPYWVYGKDAATGQPSEPFFCNAESEEAARQQASAEGILVEEVEHVEGAPEQDDSGAPQTDSAAAQADRGTPANPAPGDYRQRNSGARRITSGDMNSTLT